MKWLGITLNLNDYQSPLSFLDLYGHLHKKDIDLIRLADIDLLEGLNKLIGFENYERIVFFSIDEIGEWSNLCELTNVCDKFNLEYSFVNEGIHSDIEVRIGELIGVI